jgi:hypothetical protein
MTRHRRDVSRVAGAILAFDTRPEVHSRGTARRAWTTLFVVVATVLATPVVAAHAAWLTAGLVALVGLSASIGLGVATVKAAIALGVATGFRGGLDAARFVVRTERDRILAELDAQANVRLAPTGRSANDVVAGPEVA